jgi:hypothetical protein
MSHSDRNFVSNYAGPATFYKILSNRNKKNPLYLYRNLKRNLLDAVTNQKYNLEINTSSSGLHGRLSIFPAFINDVDNKLDVLDGNSVCLSKKDVGLQNFCNIVDLSMFHRRVSQEKLIFVILFEDGVMDAINHKSSKQSLIVKEAVRTIHDRIRNHQSTNGKNGTVGSDAYHNVYVSFLDLLPHLVRKRIHGRNFEYLAPMVTGTRKLKLGDVYSLTNKPSSSRSIELCLRMKWI